MTDYPISDEAVEAVARLDWREDKETPALVYRADPFEIIWDPAGRTEDETGGWYLWRDGDCLGIFHSLAEAQARAAIQTFLEAEGFEMERERKVKISGAHVGRDRLVGPWRKR